VTEGHDQPGVWTRQHGNAYNIFILVLTLLSLAIMVALLLPLNEEVRSTLRFYDNLICFVFLGDFFFNLSGSHPPRQYFIHHRGWLDLLGSVPSFGVFPASGLLRLFRLSRLARIMRLLRGQKKKELIADIVQNRGQYALFITMLLVLLTLTISSVLVLQFEIQSPDANITTGGDALWWAVVTITTVGYGDHYPVTPLGRMTAVGVMFAGIGIIGALASILASLLVSPAPSPQEPTGATTGEPGGHPGVDPDVHPATGAVPATGAADAATDQVPAATPTDQTHGDLAVMRADLARTREELAEVRYQLAILVDAAARRPDAGNPDGA
jgi:voltage-gated potassium channel